MHYIHDGPLGEVVSRSTESKSLPGLDAFRFTYQNLVMDRVSQTSEDVRDLFEFDTQTCLGPKLNQLKTVLDDLLHKCGLSSEFPLKDVLGDATSMLHSEQTGIPFWEQTRPLVISSTLQVLQRTVAHLQDLFSDGNAPQAHAEKGFLIEGIVAARQIIRPLLAYGAY